MSKETSVVVLGVFVALLPFLGFPESWRVVMYVLAGLGTILFGLLLRTDHLHRESAPKTTLSADRSRMNTGVKKVSDIAPAQPVGESSLVE